MTRFGRKPVHILVLAILVAVCLLAKGSLSERTPEALADQVSQLEGYYDFSKDFEMYSGYLTIQEQPEISIHYMFVTSMSNTSEADPVTLWLNGGPGCSSLLGFAQEVGPNMLLSGSKSFSSYLNPYSWNTHSNLLFFQSPPGVGFSVNKDKEYVYTDPRTAQDGTEALKLWYKRFPQFAPNKFWIAGESYCGMYIPFLAAEIMDQAPEIQLKGMLIGNGAMWLNWDWRGSIVDKFWESHYYYGKEITQLLSQCKYNKQDDHIPSCLRGQAMASKAVQYVNPYMTTSVCYTPEKSLLDILTAKEKQTRRRFNRVPFHRHNNPLLSDVQSGDGAPCTDDEGIELFFNKPKVREQLHIKTNVTWKSCADIDYNMNETSLGLFNKFKEAGLQVLLYTGNVDAVVPYIETQYYIEKLGYKQIKPKTAYKNDRGSLMGWEVEYDGLSYAIINGAGHMVPADKPHASYLMFNGFLGIRGFKQDSKVDESQSKPEISIDLQ